MTIDEDIVTHDKMINNLMESSNNYDSERVSLWLNSYTQ